MDKQEKKAQSRGFAEAGLGRKGKKSPKGRGAHRKHLRRQMQSEKISEKAKSFKMFRKERQFSGLLEVVAEKRDLRQRHHQHESLLKKKKEL